MGQLPSDQVKSAGFPTPEFFFWLSGGSASSNDFFINYDTLIAAKLLLPCGHQTTPTISGELRVCGRETIHIHPFLLHALGFSHEPSTPQLTDMDHYSLHRY
jgi:hypothetical protein